jgi:hypothetical protein
MIFDENEFRETSARVINTIEAALKEGDIPGKEYGHYIFNVLCFTLGKTIQGLSICYPNRWNEKDLTDRAMRVVTDNVESVNKDIH